jgi:hypothetical protein
MIEDDEQQASQLHDLAESIVLECKQDRPSASLETAIFLLRELLNQQSPSDPMRSDTSHHLSTALLTRFHQNSWIEDFQEVTTLIRETSMRLLKDLARGSDVLSAVSGRLFLHAINHLHRLISSAWVRAMPTETPTFPTFRNNLKPCNWLVVCSPISRTQLNILASTLAFFCTVKRSSCDRLAIRTVYPL